MNRKQTNIASIITALTLTALIVAINYLTLAAALHQTPQTAPSEPLAVNSAEPYTAAQTLPARTEKAQQINAATIDAQERDKYPNAPDAAIDASAVAQAENRNISETETGSPQTDDPEPETATTEESLTASGAILTPIGAHRIVGYDPYCAHCCSRADGITASGVTVTIGKTIAMHSIPFGTEVLIDGLGIYTVEDRGVSEGYIDIALASHSDCYQITSRRMAYVIDRNGTEAK